MINRVQFYAQDLRILRALGHRVDVATRAHQLRPADLYFVWWWTWAFQPLALAKLLRRPIIITGVFDEWAFNTRPAPHQYLMRTALAAADANVFVSQMEADVMARRFRMGPSVAVPLTVDSNVYRPDDSLREPLLLTVGWLTRGNAERKGIPLVLEAASILRRRHSSLRVVVAGTYGDGLPGLIALADRLGIRDITEFPGTVTDAEKIRLMQRCAAYVQPSAFEGFGLAALEAMACGAPVVASDGGALPEVIGDGGYAVPKPTGTSVAAAIDRILRSPELTAELSRRGVARARAEFSPQRRAEALSRIIDDAVARRV